MTSGQAELFRARLENLIDDRHELVQFAAELDWQYFCGIESFEHHLPCNPTAMVNWRKPNLLTASNP